MCIQLINALNTIYVIDGSDNINAINSFDAINANDAKNAIVNICVLIFIN